MPGAKKSTKVFIVFIAVIAAIGYLIISGLEGTFVYSRTISEVRRLGSQVEGQGLRIEGTVVSGSLQKSGTSLQCRFALADSLGESIEVRYDGVLPDTFKEGMPAVAEGKYKTGDYFEAANVLTKCPSKYEAAPEEDQASPEATS
jgi:cytochrome c-type biogenesis protein CcmE